MLQPSFKSVIEDSYRNKYYFYYSGTSVCCKEVSRDGVPRDTIVASQVSDNFLATVDLQDKIYVVCQSKEKGLYIFQYSNASWKLDQILNIQGSGNIDLLSLYGINGALHIIYAKQMAIANFYNICHLYKPISHDFYQSNVTWRKYNICEMYAEDPSASYSAIMSKDGIINMVCEWFDGSNYLINYFSFENPENSWNKKTVTSLFKKDITLNLLYDDSIAHLLCYTYEDEASAIFYYIKRDGSGKDFEFSCLDKINTNTKVSPYFHIEGSVIYASWIKDNKFYQYSLNKDQKNWVKKISSSVTGSEAIKLIEFVRNRKGRHWIIKKTFFTIDYKYNINLPYFKESIADETNTGETNSEEASLRNVDGDLVRYIPYLIEEVNSLSQIVKALSEKLEQLEAKKIIKYDYKPSGNITKPDIETQLESKEIIKLKQSNFKDQFLKSNSLLSRPEAAAVFMGPGSIPNPNEISKKEGIGFADNDNQESFATKPKPETKEAALESDISKLDNDSSINKDSNIFKKIGDFFK